ncbi:hypothetical protein, partial [Klebsiella pneumoniae]|uniref:hypothetical protein n=1 Tax=Klebsiella pneumoniae TaxID=573 RepID=UPI003013A563
MFLKLAEGESEIAHGILDFIDKAKDCGVCANAQRQCQHRHSGEAGFFSNWRKANLRSFITQRVHGIDLSSP